MRVSFALLIAVLLVVVSVRAQTIYDDLSSVYDGGDIDRDHPDETPDVPVESLGFEPPYPDEHGNEGDVVSDENHGQSPAPGRVSVIDAPPRAETCPPTGPNSKATVKKGNKQRIKVFFVVLLPSFANETVSQAFDEARLVGALKNASRARGAQHDFEVTVSSVEYISMRRRARRRSLSQSPEPLAINVKVTGEADFAGEDEMVASEIVQLLSDAPSTIFPESEFGSVQVPEATLTEVSESSWLLPVAGTLGGLACLVGLLSTYIYRGRGLSISRKKHTPELHEEGFIPTDEAKLRSMASNISQQSLLSSISSKVYGDTLTVATAREKQWNNLGYYQQ